MIAYQLMIMAGRPARSWLVGWSPIIMPSNTTNRKQHQNAAWSVGFGVLFKKKVEDQFLFK
jgi:hypothetical protein